jgi:NodT family efflux transporter outer membrane factor (OMF) lipoprotein
MKTEKSFLLLFCKKEVFLSVFVAGCTVGPDYRRPSTPMATHFKELAGWKQAAPKDDAPKGDWWAVFNDPLLNKLEQQALTANQTVLAQQAAYDQARALVAEARSALFPVLGAVTSPTRSASPRSAASPRGNTSTSIPLEATASWEIDVWGALRRQVESSQASAEASRATLANARLSAGMALATAYMELAVSDALQRVLDDTVRLDQHALDIAKNQYEAGFAAKSDVLTAQTQVEAAQSAAANVGVARGQYEHAIAVLAGMPPADLTISARAAPPAVPDIPVSLPSTLLERRPDIAAAERTMASNNALIGVAVAAYYPAVSLSAAFGVQGNGMSPLLTAANEIWSIGGSATETIFKGGEQQAAVRAAKAVYLGSVATYRQTVLTALQQVEDNLVALRLLAKQAVIQDAVVRDAGLAADITLNEYRAGTQAYTAVITAQDTLLSARQTALSIEQSRLTAAVALIGALGGGWGR